MYIILSKSVIGVFALMLTISLGLSEANAKSKRYKKSQRTYITCDRYPKHVLEKKAAKYNKNIIQSASNNRVSPHLITAVIAVESCFRQSARSSKGAAGLMQLMPATAKRFGTSRKKRYNSKYNIRAGTRYLKFLLKRYRGNVALTAAAYNAGEGAVSRYNGIPPYQETQQYVRKVLTVYKKLANYRGAKKNTHYRVSNRVSHRYQATPVKRSRSWYIHQFNKRKKSQRITRENQVLSRDELKLVRDLLY